MFKKMMLTALIGLALTATYAEAGVRISFGIGLAIFVPPPRPGYVSQAQPTSLHRPCTHRHRFMFGPLRHPCTCSPLLSVLSLPQSRSHDSWPDHAAGTSDSSEAATTGASGESLFCLFFLGNLGAFGFL